MRPPIKAECYAEEKALDAITRGPFVDWPRAMERFLAMVRRHDAIVSRVRSDRGLGPVDRAGPAPKTRRGLAEEAVRVTLAAIQAEKLRRLVARATAPA